MRDAGGRRARPASRGWHLCGARMWRGVEPGWRLRNANGAMVLPAPTSDTPGRVRVYRACRTCEPRAIAST